jgi:hypothetical protein
VIWYGGWLHFSVGSIVTADAERLKKPKLQRNDFSKKEPADKPLNATLRLVVWRLKKSLKERVWRLLTCCWFWQTVV